jgi:hypothetical protein
LSRSKYSRRRRSNRSARIITVVFSIVVVLSFVLSLVGPYTFQRPDEPTPLPTRVIPTVAPVASPTPTAEVPTPVIVTPTTSP